MTTIHAMLKRVKSVDLIELASDIVENKPQVIIDMNKDNLVHGIKKDGTQIGKYKDQGYYSRKKFAMNSKAGFGNVDLINKRAFVGGMFLKMFSSGVFDIRSRDSKSDELMTKYGDDIFGLTSDNKKKYRTDVLQPELVREVKKILIV